MGIWKPKVCLIGDSTMGVSVENYLYLMTKSVISDLAIAGGNTAGQVTGWNNLTLAQKLEFDYVVIQIGLNDISPTLGNVSAPDLIIQIKELFALVRSQIKSSCKIISSTMTPARGTIGDIGYARWLTVNEAYRGEGADAFLGDYFVSSHTTKLNDGDGYLLEAYDDGSHVHANEAGREICSDAYKEVIDFIYYQ